MPESKFKPCMQDQPMLLPPDIGDLVPKGSMPRAVDSAAIAEAARRINERIARKDVGRRPKDGETIFGDIKRDWGFRQFILRDLEKVDYEMRMVAMGHNMRKLAYALGA